MKVSSVSSENICKNKKYLPNFGKIYIEKSFWEDALLQRGNSPVKDEFISQMTLLDEENQDIDCYVSGRRETMANGLDKTYAEAIVRYTPVKVSNLFKKIDISSKNQLKGGKRRTLNTYLTANTKMSLPSAMESFRIEPKILTEDYVNGLKSLFAAHRLRYPQQYFRIAPNCDKVETVRAGLAAAERQAETVEAKTSSEIHQRIYKTIRNALTSVPQEDKLDKFYSYFYEAQAIYVSLLQPEEMPDFLSWVDKGVAAEHILSTPKGENKFKDAIKNTSIEEQGLWEDAFELIKRKTMPRTLSSIWEASAV